MKLCFLLLLLAAALFPNEGIADGVTVYEGQSAEFDCSIGIDDARNNDEDTATVAILVGSPELQDPVQCFNCTLSSRDLSLCQEMDREGRCSGLQFFNSSSGYLDMLTHNLTAQWSQVGINQSGYEVVCAVALNGVTQWVHTATLTVLPATANPHSAATITTSIPTDINVKVTVTSTTPHVTPTTPHVTPTTSNPLHVDSNKSTQSLTTGAVVGVAVSAVVGVAILGSVSALGAILLCRHRQRKHSRLTVSKEEENETLKEKL